MRVDLARQCAEIVAQTKLLTGHMDSADLTLSVPTCPGWNVSQLLRHVDGGQRWAGLEVTGDAQLVDFWLERVGFG